MCVYYIMGISYAENSFKKLNIMKVIYIHICHFSYHTFVDIGVNLILVSSVFDLRTVFNLLNAIISFSSSLFPLKPFGYNPYSLSNSVSIALIVVHVCMHACLRALCIYVCIYILKYVYETCSVHINELFAHNFRTDHLVVDNQFRALPQELSSSQLSLVAWRFLSMVDSP